jgi:hypothetical protein
VAPAEEVNVQVGHALTALFSSVDHRSVSGRGDSLLPRKRDREHRELAGDCSVAEVIQRRHVLLRDDENVYRSLRHEIAKGEAVAGVGDYLGWNLAVNDPAENALFIHCSIELR